jgi:hypothetical protein
MNVFFFVTPLNIKLRELCLLREEVGVLLWQNFNSKYVTLVEALCDFCFIDISLRYFGLHINTLHKESSEDKHISSNK